LLPGDVRQFIKWRDSFVPGFASTGQTRAGVDQGDFVRRMKNWITGIKDSEKGLHIKQPPAGGRVLLQRHAS
jgi:hypothetical protein